MHRLLMSVGMIFGGYVGWWAGGYAISTGKVKLTGSVLSHSGNTARLSLTEDGSGEERELETTIKVFDANGKPTAGLPGKGGHFEITLPKSLLFSQPKCLDEIRYYVDGVLVRSVDNTHWHQPLFLIFDSEMMPGWFGMPDDKDLPSTFSVEYVRAWKVK